ncbi:hypothetical protein BDR06DRAFT_967751 [Suillus hirtellus]|nr:hypothetical protein BDR06DRAFT_967751 [Suillus hirtellus]
MAPTPAKKKSNDSMMQKSLMNFFAKPGLSKLGDVRINVFTFGANTASAEDVIYLLDAWATIGLIIVDEGKSAHSLHLYANDHISIPVPISHAITCHYWLVVLCLGVLLRTAPLFVHRTTSKFEPDQTRHPCHATRSSRVKQVNETRRNAIALIDISDEREISTTVWCTAPPGCTLGRELTFTKSATGCEWHISPLGRSYFVYHNTRTTSWKKPKPKRWAGSLKPEDGEPVGKPLNSDGGGIGSMVVSLDETMVICGSTDSILRMWNMKEGSMIGDPWEGHNAQVRCLDWSRNSLEIASGSQDGTI